MNIKILVKLFYILYCIIYTIVIIYTVYIIYFITYTIGLYIHFSKRILHHVQNLYFSESIIEKNGV